MLVGRHSDELADVGAKAVDVGRTAELLQLMPLKKSVVAAFCIARGAAQGDEGAREGSWTWRFLAVHVLTVIMAMA